MTVARLICERCRQPGPPDDGLSDPWVCPRCKTREDRAKEADQLFAQRAVAALYVKRDPAFAAHLREGIELIEEFETATAEVRGLSGD